MYALRVSLVALCSARSPTANVGLPLFDFRKFDGTLAQERALPNLGKAVVVKGATGAVAQRFPTSRRSCAPPVRLSARIF